MGHLRLALWAALAFFVGAFGAVPSKSYEARSGNIEIADGWVRETAVGSTSGGGYFRITNSGNEADQLLKAESKVAKRIELRQGVTTGDTLRVRVLPQGIEIPAGATIQLTWESYHLLFVDLITPFKPNQPIEVTLHFAKAGPVPMVFDIRPRIYW